MNPLVNSISNIPLNFNGVSIGLSCVGSSDFGKNQNLLSFVRQGWLNMQYEELWNHHRDHCCHVVVSSDEAIGLDF